MGSCPVCGAADAVDGRFCISCGAERMSSGSGPIGRTPERLIIDLDDVDDHVAGSATQPVAGVESAVNPPSDLGGPAQPDPTRPFVRPGTGSPKRRAAGRATSGSIAPPWRRIASWTIDITVIITSVALASALHRTLGALVLVTGAPAYLMLPYLVAGGRTLGHGVVHLTVVDRRSGEQLDAARAGLRLAVIVMSLLLFAIPAIAGVVALLRGNPHGVVHDLASETSVVNT